VGDRHGTAFCYSAYLPLGLVQNQGGLLVARSVAHLIPPTEGLGRGLVFLLSKSEKCVELEGGHSVAPTRLKY